MHKWIAFARFVDVDFAAKVAQRFHGKVKTGANVFRIRGIAGDGRCFHKALQQRFVFVAVTPGEGEELVSVKRVRHSGDPPIVSARDSDYNQLNKQLQTTHNLLTKGLLGEKCNTYFGNERSSEKRWVVANLSVCGGRVSPPCSGSLVQEFKVPEGNVF
jgi:hypothetical protein